MAIRKKTNWQAPRIGAAQIRLLGQLSEACAVSGNEEAVREIVLRQVEPLVDDLQVDALGNILATKRGRGGNRPRVMLAAHMDEVGFMLVQDEGEGSFRFEVVGGIDARQLAGKPVWVGKNKTPGVIGAKPIHHTTPEERKKAIEVEALRIDLGPGNGKKAQVGDWATFATPFERIGPSLRGKALDNRIGVATLIELLKQPPPNVDLLAAFTVQEEVGLRGAGVAAYTLDPDMAIALDSTPAYDLPIWDGSENTRYNSRLDQGPAIYLADRGTLCDPRLVKLLKEAAQAYGIRHQLRQPGGGGTGAGAIHKQRGGVPSVSLSVPGRYHHSAASLVRLADWQDTLALLHAALSHIDANTLKVDR